MWSTKILISLWAFETPILSYSVLLSCLSFLRIFASGIRYIPKPSFITWQMLDLTVFLLRLIEINKFKSRRLSPRFFTISHASCAMYSTYRVYAFVPSSLGWGRYQVRVSTIPLACSILVLIALYVGTIYGIIVWKREGGRSYSEPPDCLLMDHSDINVPRKLVVKSNSIPAVVNWVYRPLLKEQLHLEVLIYPLNALAFAVKYFLGIIVLNLLIPFSPKLASEPKKEIIRPNREFLDWNYLKPVFETSTSYRDQPDYSSSPEEPDILALEIEASNEQRPTDALSLHTIHDDTPEPLIRPRTTLQSELVMPERLLGPRYLCYLDASQPQGYKTMSTRDWGQANDIDGTTDYIFVSYTRRQFYTQITGDPSLPTETSTRLQEAVARDTATLIEFAISAAKAANIEAFWIDYECVRPEDGESTEDSMEDVYRICDIVRSAHSMAIVTGPSLLLPDYEHDNNTSKVEWLQDWGKRLWTVPEALLCPAEHRIAVYSVGTSAPEYVARRNLASRVWDDANTLRQLIDHYESSIHLTPLEFISIALDCLQRRQTVKRMNGDVAYALMGLLRLRPKVVKEDSSFQAFARLSLANDSHMLLERLICLRASSPTAPWHDLHDFWGARLWDIEPLCQVSAIVDKNTILIGGTQGAIINWSYLHPVDYTAVARRRWAWHIVRHPPSVLFAFLFAGFIGYIVIVELMTNLSRRGVFLSLLKNLGPQATVCAISALFTPALLWRLYNRDINDTQARFFGIEGVPELGEVEKHIFGRNKQRFQWVSSSNSGQPSRNRDLSPIRQDGLRQFTLIDTLTLSAIKFEARTPPNIVVACGRERGFVRSLLCSYNASVNTFTKEIVLRMPMTVLDRMPKMEFFRFTLSSEELESE